MTKESDITCLAELEAAARQDRLKSVEGLGAAVQRKIRDDALLGAALLALDHTAA